MKITSDPKPGVTVYAGAQPPHVVADMWRTFRNLVREGTRCVYCKRWLDSEWTPACKKCYQLDQLAKILDDNL
jgi:DNA-directed RNA polymerase subunit N (RpoN/RPB10)